jgi:hypothetical protein
VTWRWCGFCGLDGRIDPGPRLAILVRDVITESLAWKVGLVLFRGSLLHESEM